MIRKLSHVAALCIAVVMLLLPLSVAALPGTITFQGYLTDSSGVPVTGSKDMVFSLYTVSSGGTAAWTETHSAVNVDKGIYAVELGSTTALTDTILSNTALYLGIKLSTETTEMTPRQKVTAVAYALRAKTAETAETALTSQNLSCTGCVNATDIASGAVTAAKLATGSVTDVKIATGISGSKISGDIAGNAANVTGTVGITSGGTGITTAPTAAGQYLRSTGLLWGVGTIQAGDLPASVMTISSAQTVTGIKTFNPSSGAVPFVVGTGKTGTVSNLNAEMLAGNRISDFDLRYRRALAPVPRSNTISAVDVSGGGLYTSVTIGADGLPVVSYYSDTTSDLKVAHCGDAACSTGNMITTVDAANNVGKYSSIAIGLDGFPVISYYDQTNYDLKVVKCGNEMCSSGNVISVVDNGGVNAVGSHTSLAIGRDGVPVIAYHDITDTDLKVARCINIECSGTATITAVDTGLADLGKYASLAIGVDGIPCIAYRDGSVALKFARCANAECTGAAAFSTIDSPVSVTDISLAIGADGLPVISYLDGPDLKVAKCGDLACSGVMLVKTTVNPGGCSLDYQTSLSIGADGKPVISCYAPSTNDLKFVKCGNEDCTSGNAIVIPDQAGLTGQYSSVTIGTDGNPVIAYRSGSNLNVLKCANAFCITNWSRR